VVISNEKKVGNVPNNISCADFQDWLNDCDMLDIPIQSHEFTWSNGRRGNQRIDMRLDRAVCGVSCLDDWKTIACSTLARCNSDHHLIFLKMGDLVGGIMFLIFWLCGMKEKTARILLKKSGVLLLLVVLCLPCRKSLRHSRLH